MMRTQHYLQALLVIGGLVIIMGYMMEILISNVGVECSTNTFPMKLNHEIIAGGVLDPILNLDASKSRLKAPAGGCSCPNGDLYLCDFDAQLATTSTAAHRVFVVDGVTNKLSVYAGNGLDRTGGDGGDALSAGLQPFTCTCDRNGDLYVLDWPYTGNHSVRVINRSTRKISLIVDGLDKPNGIAVDEKYIYIAETGTNKVKKIDKITKQITVIVGGGANTNENVIGTDAVINGLSGLAIGDDGSIYYCEKNGVVVRKMDINGYVTTIAGQRGVLCINYNGGVCGDGQLASVSTLAAPLFVHVQQNGNIVILDTGRIRSINNLGIISTLVDSGALQGEFPGGSMGDGAPAIGASIRTVDGSCVGLFSFNNTVYFGSRPNKRYRKVENGYIYNGVGTYSDNYFGEGGLLANIAFPTDVTSFAFDSNETLYIGTRSTIYKVDNLTGIVSRVAGGFGGQSWGNNVEGQYSLFGDTINKMVIDSHNHMYLVDSYFHCIRKVDLSTNFVTMAVGTATHGNGVPDIGTNVGLNTPRGLCLDENEDIIIMDSGNCKIRKYTKSTKQVTNLYNFEVGGVCYAFVGPFSCAVSRSGDIYFSSQYRMIMVLKKSDNSVSRVAGNENTYCNQNGYAQTECGNGLDAGHADVKLGGVSDLVIHPSNNELYFTERDASMYGSSCYGLIRKIDLTTNIISVVAGTGSCVMDTFGVGNKGVDAFSTGQWSNPLTTSLTPGGLAFSKDGRMIFTDGTKIGNIRITDSENRLIAIAGHYDESTDKVVYSGENRLALETHLCRPTSLAKRKNNTDLYIGLTCKSIPASNSLLTYSRIVKLDAITGRINTIAGNFKDNSFPQDNINALQVSVRPLQSNAQNINNPFGIQVNELGEVYYSDSKSNQVRKINTNGTVSTIAGTGGTCVSTDACGDNGLAINAQIVKPTALFLDETGALYISDLSNSKIRKIENNIITTVVGSGVQCTSSMNDCDNTNPLLVKLSNPSGIYVTKSGDLYIADTMGSKIRKLSAGVMSIVAGASINGCKLSDCGENIDPTTANLYNPTGIFVDEETEDVYITDQLSVIRRISQKQGKITTIAGSPKVSRYSYTDGSVQFNNPAAILQTSKGILVADTENNMIRLINYTCPSGHSGLVCSVFNCFGVSNDNSSVCSGNGECISLDKCLCKDGYDGDSCNTRMCYGKSSKDSNVCSGRGNCDTTTGLCQCFDNYNGSVCNETSCFGVDNYNTTVCNGNGNCNDFNNCSCYSGWEGEICDVYTCFGVMVNNVHVCNGNGVCLSVNNCNCSNNWIGSNCDVTYCYGVISNDTSVCNGNGLCTSLDKCQCESGWSGQYCNITYCYDIAASDSSVCSGNGVCRKWNDCYCDNDWFGENCNITTCFSVLANQSNVCGGHGKCVDTDSCVCSSSWKGRNCNVTTCNGLPSNESSVCSGHGSCVDLNNCECFTDWFGNECSIPTCFGKLANQTSVCSGNGACIGAGKCSCNNGWIGSNCNITQCDGILSNDSSVCTGNGKCNSPNKCTCYPGFFNSNCNITSCFGILSNHSSVCQTHGTCTFPDTCSCKSNWLGEDCSITSCYGILANNSNVCSGAGKCIDTNHCSCNVDYYTNDCSTYCKPEMTCFGHGNCTITGACQCHSDSILGLWTLSNCSQCQMGYYGDMCLTHISTSIQLSNDFKELEFSLHSPPFFTASYVSCSQLLSPTDFVKLGSPTQCQWVNKTSGEFIIQLGSLNSLQIGDILDINVNIFNKVSSIPLFNHLTVQAPLNPIKPVAVISTTTKSFSSCDEISVVGATIDANGDEKYYWSIITSPLSVLELSQICYNDSILVLNSQYQPGNYTVQLVVSNKFNIQSEPVYYSFMKEGFTMPTINILGLEQINIQFNRVPIYVKQYISYSACSLNDSLSMSSVSIIWKQLVGPLSNFTQLSNNDLIINSFADQSAQNYVYQVILTFMNRTITKEITVNTMEPDFGIILYQSDVNSTHVTVHVESDPPEAILTLSNWKWTCKTEDHVDCEQVILDQLAYHSQIRSTSFSLKAGSSRTIGLYLQINSRIGEITITYIQDQFIPIINLLYVTPLSKFVTRSEVLTLQLMVSVNEEVDGIDSLIQREWKLNSKLLTTPELIYPEDPSGSNYVSLDLSALPEGSSNNLTFTVTSISGQVSTFSYTFTVVSNPKPCYCAISPPSGYALETIFSINCQSCVLSSGTVLQISFLDYETGLKISLTEGTTSTKISTQLPYTGSTILPLYFTVKNTQTGAKTETSLSQQVLIPKASSLYVMNSKRTTWDAYYNTLASGDPRKTVFEYIYSTVQAMNALITRRSLVRDTIVKCMNAGTFNNYYQQCSCPNGYKKSDCSMNLNQWNETATDKWLAAKVILGEIELRNEIEPQSENKLSAQLSLIYRLLQAYDVISRETFDHIFTTIQKQIKSLKSDPYLSISKNLANVLSKTLNFLVKSKISIDGQISEEFSNVMYEFISDLATIRFRNQILGTSDDFDMLIFKLTAAKYYPSDLSSQKVGGIVNLPNKMTRYLQNPNLRKLVGVRIKKRMLETTVNETRASSADSLVITNLRTADHTLFLETTNQLLNVPANEKVLTYLFQFSKMVNDSIVSEPTRIINTTSRVICISSAATLCNVEQLEANLFACNCSQLPSNIGVTIGERVITQIKQLDDQILINSNNDLAYLAFLTFVPIGMVIVIVLVIIILCKKMRKRSKIEPL